MDPTYSLASQKTHDFSGSSDKQKAAEVIMVFSVA